MIDLGNVRMKSKLLLVLIGLVFTGCATSPGGVPIVFDPDFFRGVHNEAPFPVIQGTGNRKIRTDNERFDTWACMSMSKVVTLINILSEARLPATLAEFKALSKEKLEILDEQSYADIREQSIYAKRKLQLFYWGGTRRSPEEEAEWLELDAPN